MNDFNNIAVLIDADNASAKTIGLVLTKIEEYGKITCKKIYGDWGQNNLSSWQEALLRYAIEPMQQFAYVKGKNATDIAMVIEAMDLLHSGEYDCFCLVSSDSDFTSLAVRIRKNHIPVFGFGEKKAITSFRQACDKFFEVESLNSSRKPSTTETTTASKLNTQNPLPKPWTSSQLKSDTKLLNALREVINELSNQSQDWVHYSTFHQVFKNKYPTLNIQKYGYHKLIKLLEQIDIFDIKNEGGTVAIRYKTKNANNATQQTTKYTTQQLQADIVLVDALTKIIQENPNPQEGWTNISYLASQINQNYPNVQLKKYGYAKFSDLISNLKLFDIKKHNNGVFVKLKQTTSRQLANKTNTTATIESQASTPLILNNKIQVSIATGYPADAVLWRITANKKVRGDEDMIFYGQTHSDDNSMSLDITLENTAYQQQVVSVFECHLHHQPIDIQRLIFTLSHETGSIAHQEPIGLIISQQANILFEGEFLVNQTTAQSVFLFELIKVDTGWQFFPRKQLINGDLRALCGRLGVEVADD